MIHKKLLNTAVIISVLFILITGISIFFFYNNSITIIINNKQEPIIQAKEAPTVQILVATNDIVTGKKILSDDLSWRAWPKNLLSQEYITFDKNPDMIQSLIGGIAKMPIVSGEPIIQGKNVSIHKSVDKNRTDLTLKKGMRAVSVPITNTSIGFILPGDYVDVIFTTAIVQQNLFAPQYNDSGVKKPVLKEYLELRTLSKTRKKLSKNTHTNTKDDANEDANVVAENETIMIDKSNSNKHQIIIYTMLMVFVLCLIPWGFVQIDIGSKIFIV